MNTWAAITLHTITIVILRRTCHVLLTELRACGHFLSHPDNYYSKTMPWNNNSRVRGLLYAHRSTVFKIWQHHDFNFRQRNEVLSLYKIMTKTAQV